MGGLVWVMQHTEKIVDVVITYLIQEEEKLTLEYIERQEKEKRSRTLGRLVKQMRDRAELDPSLDTLLENFVEHRNQLTHRLSEIPGWDSFETENGRKVTVEFLANLNRENRQVLQIFTGFLIAWDHKNNIGIIEKKAEPLVKLMPDILKYAASIDQLVSAKPDRAGSGGETR
jgi:hypothetical protein